MPTYEYACRDCGEHVEVVQSFRDDPLTECGLCGGALRKVFSAAGIIFKGSGYYVTDSRKEGIKAGSSSEPASDSSASDSSADSSASDSSASDSSADTGSAESSKSGSSKSSDGGSSDGGSSDGGSGVAESA